MRKKNGFTLVELLSTVVILAVVFSITVYLVVKNIGKAKDDATLINYTNIKNIAKVYTDEVSSYWNVKDSYECSCISLGNMIEIGYFDEKVIDENDKLTKDTMLKVIRDKDSKVIKETSFSFEDSILPDVDCGYQSSVAISAKRLEKDVSTKILYNTLGSDYYKYFYLSGFKENTITTNDVVYACDNIGSCSNNTVSNLESGHWYLTNNDVVRLIMKSNGVISAFVNYQGNNVAEATMNVDFVDNTPPVISLSVYKIGSYEGNSPKTKGELVTTISSDYTVSEWKNYGYWFDISTNEDSVIKWTYNNEGSINGGSPSNSGANCNNSCSKTLSGDGNRKATIVATDSAGNSSKIEINILIDRTPPTRPVINNTNSNKWVNNDYSLTIKSKDVFSGLANIQYSTDNANWITIANSSATANTEKTVSSLVSTEGQYNYYVRACDNVGNCSSSYSVIKIDKTKPVITWGSNAPGEYENNAGISVNAVCTDSGSGVSKSNLDSITISSPTNGKEITFTCIDSAGNSQSLKGMFYVKTSSADSSCGVENYKSCQNIDCGYEKCRAAPCGVEYYTWLCASDLAGTRTFYVYSYYHPSYQYCSIAGTTYNKCENSACPAKTCRTEKCGIESYKVCWHY